jgi:integrase/recombinase XerD
VTTDEQLVTLWLHERSPHTVRAYRRIIARFRVFVAKPLRVVTLADLQTFSDSLNGAPASRAQTLATVKSLLTFGQEIGALPFNVGKRLRVPKSRDGLTERILTEAQVQKMLALSTGRDHALIRVLYAAGARVSEACALQWAHVVEAENDGAFVTLFGKGGKTRGVRVSPETAAVLKALRGDRPDDHFVFVGRKGALDASSAWRVVRAVAKKAGIRKAIGPHHFRHAHASHALARGASLVLVRDTLGHVSIATTDKYLHARPGESSGRYLPV